MAFTDVTQIWSYCDSTIFLKPEPGSSAMNMREQLSNSRQDRQSLARQNRSFPCVWMNDSILKCVLEYTAQFLASCYEIQFFIMFLESEGHLFACGAVFSLEPQF